MLIRAVAHAGPEFWWNERKPDEPWGCGTARSNWARSSTRRSSSHSVPLDLNILTALKRSSLGIDFYLWLTYRTFTLNRSVAALLGEPLWPVRGESSPGGRKSHRPGFSCGLSAGVEEDQDGLARAELYDGQGSVDPLAFEARHRPYARPARGTAPQGIFPGPKLLPDDMRWVFVRGALQCVQRASGRYSSTGCL